MECSIPEINNFHNLQNNLKKTIQLPTFRDKRNRDFISSRSRQIILSCMDLRPAISNKSDSPCSSQGLHLIQEMKTWTYIFGYTVPMIKDDPKNVRIWMFSCCPPTMFRTDFENLIEWILDEKHVKRVKFHNSQEKHFMILRILSIVLSFQFCYIYWFLKTLN